MPVWSKLPEPERWQIVTFLQSLTRAIAEPAIIDRTSHDRTSHARTSLDAKTGTFSVGNLRTGAALRSPEHRPEDPRNIARKIPKIAAPQ